MVYADSIDVFVKTSRATAIGGPVEDAERAADAVWEEMQDAFAACGTTPPTVD